MGGSGGDREKAGLWRDKIASTLLKTLGLVDLFFSSAPSLKRQRGQDCLAQASMGSEDETIEGQRGCDMHSEQCWCSVPNPSHWLGHKHPCRPGWSHLRG